MERPTQRYLAFDIDHLAAAKPHLRGNPGRGAEGELAEADHGKPVHLTDLSAIGLDMDCLAADLFLQATVDAVATAELRVDRRLHLGLADHVFTVVCCDLVG